MNCRALGFVVCAFLIPGTISAELLNEVPPAGVLIEAELRPANGLVKVLDEPNASGGKVVTTSGSWQPLFIAAVPEGGDQLTLWIRHRGGAICLKTVVGGEMGKDHWIWSQPATWAWTSP